MPSEQQTVAPAHDEAATSAAQKRARQLRADVALTVVLIGLVIVYASQAFNLPQESPNRADVGPRAYPLLILAMLVTATVILAGATAVRWWQRARPPRGRNPAEIRQRLRLLEMVVVSVIYLQVVVPLGFVVASALYLALQAVIMVGVRGWRPVAIVLAFGIVTSLVIYLLFARALGVLLPQGLLPL